MSDRSEAISPQLYARTGGVLYLIIIVAGAFAELFVRSKLIVSGEARTTAAKETSGEGVIPTQWQKFAVEGVLAKIPNKADQNAYEVYTDFANKRYGEYSVVLGARVTDKSHVPAGLVLKTIPAGKYAIFQSEKGPAEQVIAAAWQKIADAEDQEKLGYIRTYKADYLVYQAQAMDPRNLRGELHVGVK